MSRQITIEQKNKLSEISRLSHFINEDRELKYLPQQMFFALELSLEEILTNVISYGYDDNQEHNIRVRIHFDEREVCVEVEDDGKPFNPLEAETPDIKKPLADRPIGGLGIHLVRTFMDNLEYSRNGDKKYFNNEKEIQLRSRSQLLNNRTKTRLTAESCRASINRLKVLSVNVRNNAPVQSKK